METLKHLVQGWVVWGFALLLAITLPGLPWRLARPGPFPLEALLPALLAIASLAACTLGAVGFAGSRLARSPTLAALEAPPDLLWGALVLALWPAAWGPPGLPGWLLAFLLAALPTEIRWISQALPPERPFPEAWGPEVQRRVRFQVLLRILPRWIAVRLPLWITATLILERILAVPGLGSDWMTRFAQRDQRGLVLWILLFALLWTLIQRGERSPS
jgi:hypothetical protein